MALHTLCNLLSMMMTLKMADHRRICIVMNTITWPWSWPWPHQLDSRPWLDVLKLQLHVKTEICTSSYSPNETQTYNTALLLWPWPHDLQIQGWPTCYQDVPAYQNDVSGSRLSKIRAWKGQTDRHTYRDANQRLQCCVNSYRPRELISLGGKVTAGMVESNGSLPPGLWLMSSVDWLPRNQDQLRVQRL